MGIQSNPYPLRVDAAIMAKFKVINKVKENGKFYILLEELE